MSQHKASAFVKAGTCIRYLVDVREGSAIGRAWPDPGQSETDKTNSRGEKIHQDANVLDNMQKIDTLLNSAGFSNVREGDRKHLRDVLVPEAALIKNQDDGRGVLTAELAENISSTAREIRKGLLEAADKVTLYTEPDNSEKWPSQFDTKLLWTVPWWLVLAFVTTIGLSVSFTETKIYNDIKESFSPEEEATSGTGMAPGNKTDQTNQSEKQADR